MSGNLDEAGQDPLGPAPRAVPSRSSWLYFLGGSTVLAVAALAGTAVLAQFLDNRPLNLRPLSAHFAGVVIETLQQHFVPDKGIRQSGPELRQNASSSLYYYSFDVDVPPQLNAATVAALTEKSLRDRLVETQAIPIESAVAGLSLSLSGLEFARIAFHAPPAGTATPLTDLRAACVHMAQELFAFLIAHSIPEKSIVQEPGSEQRDDLALWTLTSFRVSAPEGLRTDDWAAALNQSLVQPGSEVRMRTGAAGEQIVEGFVSGKMAVSAVLHFSTSKEVPPMAADLDDVVKIALPTFDELPLDSVDYGPAGKKAPREGETLPAAEPGKESEELPSPIPQIPDKLPIPKAGTPKDLAKAAKIAIILDDGGYHRPENEPALDLDPGLTLSILPHTPHGKALAEAAEAAGFEVMLHMPMQTHSKKIKPFPGQINTDMDADTIERLTNEALAQVPGAVGANNHTGSLFTSDPERMRVFLDVLKKRGLYFVDSLTIASSEAFEVAEDMEVPAAQRTVFLDNTPDPESIQAQFKALVEAAQNNGHAIGIGHFRKNTVAVLEELLPTLAEEGCQLVHVSELVR